MTIIMMIIPTKKSYQIKIQKENVITHLVHQVIRGVRFQRKKFKILNDNDNDIDNDNEPIISSENNLI